MPLHTGSQQGDIFMITTLTHEKATLVSTPLMSLGKNTTHYLACPQN